MKQANCKKLLAVLLALALCLSLLPTAVFAVNDGESSDAGIVSSAGESSGVSDAEGSGEDPSEPAGQETPEGEESSEIEESTESEEPAGAEEPVDAEEPTEEKGPADADSEEGIAALSEDEVENASNDTLTVDASADETEGKTYQTIQAAIDYISGQEVKTDWTITVQAGTYARFTVLNGLDNLTVRAAEGAEVVIEVCNDSPAPAAPSGAYPDTAGVSIRQASGVTLQGLTFDMGSQSSPWTSAAVSNYTESGVKGDNVSVSYCSFRGSGSNIGVFINTGTTRFTVTDCAFDGMTEAISMYGDGTLMDSATVTGNTFTNCSFAIHGYYGGTGDAGTLTFANNSVTGSDTYCKIVIQDQTNTGAIKADVRSNDLTNAIVGLVNLREAGETISDVLTSNHFVSNSFYVEAVEPGTIDFYTTYQAPTSGNGHWELTGKADFDVDWGKNPDGSTAAIQELVAAANASGSKTLSITGIDADNLIKTFTWFKDGIYWVTDPDEEEPDVPVIPADPDWDVSRSKTATNLDENYESEVTLSLPSAEEQLVSDVVFVLDKSTSAELEEQALAMLQQLQAQLEGTGAKINVGVVIFNKMANSFGFYDLATQYSDIETAITKTISSGTNSHAGLLAGIDMLAKDTSVDDSRKYLIFVSDGITYMYNEVPTATAWTFKADTVLNWAGPDNWASKYGTNDAPADWGAYLAKVGAMVKHQGTDYEYPYGGTATKSTPISGQFIYANSVDKALYLTYQAYQEAAGKYHCYAMTATQAKGTQYEWGPSFISYLANGEEINFAQIQNDIVYLVDVGSCVEDYMGYVADDYNFDFVNNASALTLTVGEDSYAAVQIAENEYGFKPLEDGSYAYTVAYDAGNLKDTEHFIWSINEAITNFAPVQLTYTVRLADPQTEAGTYGAYDADGSEGYDGLYTNNSATLYPVDTNSNEGAPQEFAKPTVSYTVQETPVTPTEPTKPTEPTQPTQPADPGQPGQPTQTTSTTTTTTQQTQTTTPKTGDSVNLLLPIGLIGLCAAALGVLIPLSKKRGYTGRREK